MPAPRHHLRAPGLQKGWKNWDRFVPAYLVVLEKTTSGTLVFVQTGVLVGDKGLRLRVPHHHPHVCTVNWGGFNLGFTHNVQGSFVSPGLTSSDQGLH